MVSRRKNMGLFTSIKNKAINDAKSGKKYKEKDPSEMSERELDKEILSNKSIFYKKKYCEEKLKRTK